MQEADYVIFDETECRENAINAAVNACIIKLSGLSDSEANVAIERLSREIIERREKAISDAQDLINQKKISVDALKKTFNRV